MITIRELENDDLEVGQSLDKPSVYLDHWALMEFAHDNALADALERAIRSKRGTLVLSWLNLVEFTVVEDRQQATESERFVDRLWLRLFFLEADPFKAARRGLAGSGDLSWIDSIADSDTLKSVVLHSYQEGKELSFHGMLQAVQTDEMKSIFQGFSERMAAYIRAIASEMKADKNKRRLGNAETSLTLLNDPVYFIRRELLRRLLKSKSEGISSNDAVDFMHATKAVTYCSYVLLDGQWAALMEEVRTWLERQNHSSPYGKTFSKRDSGISKFLNEFQEDI
jgi:hypothetical protein